MLYSLVEFGAQSLQRNSSTSFFRLTVTFNKMQHQTPKTITHVPYADSVYAIPALLFFYMCRG
jgi:hypothetical protein